MTIVHEDISKMTILFGLGYLQKYMLYENNFFCKLEYVRYREMSAYTINSAYNVINIIAYKYAATGIPSKHKK